MKWRYSRNSHVEQAHSSVPRVKKQTDENLYSLKSSPPTKAKNPLSVEGKMKKSSCDYRHHPVCRGYKSGNRCVHGYRCLCRQADGERKPSARSRKEGTQASVAILERKKKRCVAQDSDRNNSLLRNVEELGLTASAGHTRKFSGCIWCESGLGKEKGNLEALLKKVNFMSEILARLVLKNNHLRKPHGKQVVPAK